MKNPYLKKCEETLEGLLKAIDELREDQPEVAEHYLNKTLQVQQEAINKLSNN